jgi:hypothetical protein
MSEGRPGLLLRVRGHLSLTRVQAVFGIIAALLSIGGALYGYLRPGRAPDTGEVVAIIQEAKSGKPVPDATVELLTPKDALVTTLATTGAEARRPMKEGTYRLRVTHPRYVTEVRQIQVLPGRDPRAPRSPSSHHLAADARRAGGQRQRGEPEEDLPLARRAR